MSDVEPDSAFRHQFLSLFSARGDSMIRNAESGSWRRMSQFHLLTDDEIMAALSDGSSVIRAVSFDRTTRYAAIELPDHSPYLEISAFRNLIELLGGLGLKPRVYMASGSRDVQLFLFFSQPYKCAIVQEALAKVLSWNGFSLRADKLVVYPSDVALPLPLQRGFVWLNEDLQPIVSRNEIALDSALALFCSEASRYATEFEAVIDGANMLPSADLTAAEFWGLNPNKVEAEAAELTKEVQSEVPMSHYGETGSFVEVPLDENTFRPTNVIELPFPSTAEPSVNLFTRETTYQARDTKQVYESLEYDAPENQDDLSAQDAPGNVKYVLSEDDAPVENLDDVLSEEQDEASVDNLEDILSEDMLDVLPENLADVLSESEVALPDYLSEDVHDESPFNFAVIDKGESEKPEPLKNFPLWLVEEELGVEVFPVPADQEALEDMLIDESAEEELEQVATQGQTDSDLWPRQNSQLLLLSNEPAPDVQLDLFSRKNLNRGEQPSARPRRKRNRVDETNKPED